MVLTVAAVAQLAAAGGAWAGVAAAEGEAPQAEEAVWVGDDPTLQTEVAAVATLLTKLATDSRMASAQRAPSGGGGAEAADCKCTPAAT